MPNAVYPEARDAFLTADIDLLADDIRAILLLNGYVYNAAHDFLDDVSAGFRVATSAAMTGKTVDAGVFRANNVPFGVIAAGPAIRKLVLYQHTGSEATSRLIYFADTLAAGVAINFTPDGTSVTAVWGAGPTGIFRL